MKSLTRNTSLFFLLLFGLLTQNVQAQNALDPNDPIITYDASHPPTEPAWGQIGKWVRTVRMGWNTSGFKCYIYKGKAFRLHFPKTYNPTAVDGKKYPMIVFFHGLGEAGPNTDNEYQLLHGGAQFDAAVNNGTFDGFILCMQSGGFFGNTEYLYISEILDQMMASNKLDPFRITMNGLSAGGQGCWDMLTNYPTYTAATLPMSSCSWVYGTPSVVDPTKYTPIWLFQGGLDGNPAPYTSQQVRDAYKAAGGNFTYKEYSTLDHWTWDSAWQEPNFYPFVNAAYMSNPWPTAKTDYYAGEAINVTLGLKPGLQAYQWRKDGVVLPTALSNTLVVTQFGTYDARVQRNGVWSEWSRIPVQVRLKAFPPLPIRIEAEDYTNMSGVNKETTADVNGNLDVASIDPNDWMEYSLVVPATGTYYLRFRVASPTPSAQFQVRKPDGTVLATVNPLNTGGYQSWRTVTTPINLTQGVQTIRVLSTGPTAWNLNWLELTTDPTIPNELPVAHAGADQTVILPTNSAQLNGSGTDADGTITGYNWSLVSGPAGSSLSNPNIANPVLNGLVAGTYNLRLTVTDNNGATGTDIMQVLVNNNTPIGTTIHIEAESYSSMSGIQTENTLDVGGGLNVGFIDPSDWMAYNVNVPTSGLYTVNLRIAAPGYSSKIQIQRADGTILGTVTLPHTSDWQSWTTATTTISLTPGQQVIKIVDISPASNNWNFNWFDLVYTSATGTPANIPPTAWAGNDVTLTLPNNSVQLNGSGTDVDGTIASYRWAKVSGPDLSMNSVTIPNPTAGNLTAGVYVFRLTVTDNSGASASDDVQVTVNPGNGNTAPTANAGPDQTIQLPASSAQLAGSGSDADGTIAGYGWTLISGPAGSSFSNASIANPTVNGLVAGVYTFRLTVTDNGGATGQDDVVITVTSNNVAPTANAGPDQTIQLPASTVQLAGSGADQDGTISSYAWSYVSGPAGSSFSNASIANPTVSGLVAGTYTFRLTVTDNGGATATDTVVITVTAANVVPTANAGADQVINVPANTVQLTGSGSDLDGTITTYAWSKISGPAGSSFSSAATAATAVSGLVAGTYVFRLTVTDNNGATGTDDVTVTVNQVPTANAGTDQTITQPANSVQLTGTGTDPDGTITTYAWTKVSGPAGSSFTSAATANTSVNGLVAGSYTFRLTVTDNNGATATDDVVITVNPGNNAPTVNAGPDQTIQLPTSSVLLAGSASDIDGTITTYAWTKVSGPAGSSFSSTSITNPTVSGLVAGTYTFRLTATDNGGATASDDVVITVNPANVAPVANAGTDVTVTLPTSSVQLNGSGTDADGTVSSYAWSFVSGPAGSGFSSSTTATTTISGLVQGVYTFRLTVTDNNGATGTDDVVVTVNAAANVPPVANAGPDQTIQLPTNTVQLAGSGTDANGTITSYAWSKVSGPAGSSFSSTSIPNPTVNGLTAGTYTFRLTVTDNNGATGTDDVVITVNPANVAPVANAGTDKSINPPANSVTLTGSGTDADGTVTGYAWSKISGPAGSSFGSPAAATTTVTGLVAGTYTFRLTVTDNNGATGTDDVIVFVNTPPTANAGADKIVSLPITTVQLVGSGTDPDGSISTYAWTKVSGPAGSTFTTTTASTTTVNGLAVGSYTFRLTVTDNNGATASDDVVVTVNPGNAAPTVNAGPDQTIYLPASSATLTGTATDVDGTISTYNWTKVSGPAGGTFANNNLASTTVSSLVAGTYTFRLTATDNLGATGTDDVVITVTTAPTTLHIEAESYSNMFGIRTETTTDVGGGLNVGYIDPSDWMDYTVNVPATGTYTVKFRTSTPAYGAKLQLKKADGTVLTTVSLPFTGGYQNWVTTTATVTLTAGVQTIRVFDFSPLWNSWNFNWWELVQGTAGATGTTPVTLVPTPTVIPVDAYPNPVINQMLLRVNNNLTGKMKVHIMNQHGDGLKEMEFNKPATGLYQTTINLSALRPGTYIVTVKMKDWHQAITIIKL